MHQSLIYNEPRLLHEYQAAIEQKILRPPSNGPRHVVAHSSNQVVP